MSSRWPTALGLQREQHPPLPSPGSSAPVQRPLVTERSTGPLNVIKIGGGLVSVPGALDRVCREVSAAAVHHRMIVVPGGGPFADAVRAYDRSFPLSATAAHWMALLAMDQYGH